METIAELGRGHGKMDRRCSARSLSVYLVVSQSRWLFFGGSLYYVFPLELQSWSLVQQVLTPDLAYYVYLPLAIQKTCDQEAVIKYLHKYTEIWPLAFSPCSGTKLLSLLAFNHLCFLSLHPLRFTTSFFVGSRSLWSQEPTQATRASRERTTLPHLGNVATDSLEQ